MKKRKTIIPDFSTKKPNKFGAPSTANAHQPTPHPAEPRVKPQATSSKSGRRGS
jgi:hypothetical protein